MPTPGPESWTDITAVKAHLNITGATNDAELVEFIRRAEVALVQRIGHVKVPDVAIVEYADGGGTAVHLDEVPIASVEAITVYGVTVPAADLDTGARGWYLASGEAGRRAGLIQHTDRFPTGFVKVLFKPGRVPIPEDLELATLELIRHLWKTQRGNLGGRPGLMGEAVDQPDMGPRGGAVGQSGFSFPRRVTEMIAPYTLPVIG